MSAFASLINRLGRMLFTTMRHCLSLCIGKLPNISFKADGFAAA